jgi:hypothetical protein
MGIGYFAQAYPLMKKGFWLDLEDEKEELCDISRGVPSTRPRSLYL